MSTFAMRLPVILAGAVMSTSGLVPLNSLDERRHKLGRRPLALSRCDTAQTESFGESE